MEEPAIHARAVQISHGAGVAVGQNRFGTESSGDGGEAFGDGVEGLLPTASLEAPFTLCPPPAHGIEQPLRRVDPLEITRHFATKKAARYGMIGVAADPHGAAVLDLELHRARVGTIVSTDGI